MMPVSVSGFIEGPERELDGQKPTTSGTAGSTSSSGSAVRCWTRLR